jgi:hypothetical protein
MICLTWPQLVIAALVVLALVVVLIAWRGPEA